jgi:nitrite reductase/ring-hydroxylating ferredoxin subunit
MGGKGVRLMDALSDDFVRAARLDEVRAAGRASVRVGGHSLALFFHDGRVHAVDNRCPHMGFPLHRGTLQEGILTCHWHHARFDLQSGGPFDQFTDEARVFPVELRDGEVWVDLSQQKDRSDYLRQRLRDGLERNISLVIAKSAIGLLGSGEDATEPFRVGLEFGAGYRRAGWGQGLTMHACMMNLLPYLGTEDRPRALYHGLTAVSRDSAGQPPRFSLRPLPTETVDLATLKGWFRRFVEVRDAEGAERCIVSAVRAGADDVQMADMLFCAATDHRYLDVGHVLDFTNKAFEALEVAGWSHAEAVLPGLAPGYANARRMEESNSWRNPVDLVEVLDDAFERLPGVAEQARALRGRWEGCWEGGEQLAAVLLGEDAVAIAGALLGALEEGATEEDLAGAVAYAAALRIARFPTTNEFGDWDTALHTFTFSNAVYQELRRAPSPELLRGVFDAAMSVNLDRFLNVPPARIPEPHGSEAAPEDLLAELRTLLDQRQRVDEAGELVAGYLFGGGEAGRLLAVMGGLLLREDRDFHTIQAIEAAFRQYARLRDKKAGAHVLLAAARYLAAHSPTMRSQGQTYDIARRLSRGEILYEE